jgi:RNA recognition motif-containing protein
MKGQAFVVFTNEESSQKAMHDLQSYNFFGKRMVMILDSFL